MKKLKFIVTGTGRCGTVFAARYLTSIGIKCVHECFFNRDGLKEAKFRLKHPEHISTSIVSGNSWLYDSIDIIAESSYMAAPFLNENLLNEAKVIHIIRNPIEVVSSFVTAFNYFNNPAELTTYERFIFDHIPDLYEDMSQLERACLFLLEWNAMIVERSEGKPYLLHRIEDNPQNILEFVGNPIHDPDDVFQDTKVNSFPKRLIEMKDIPQGNIRERFEQFAELHKYSMN